MASGPVPDLGQYEVVSDFNEFTFRAPRPGYFLGDAPDLEGQTYQPGQPPPLTSRSPPYLGLLDKLPLEVIHSILAMSDVRTVAMFSKVSQLAEEMTKSLKGYQESFLFPGLLDAASMTHVAVTIDELATLVRNPQCAHCRHFGDMFCLLALQRLCYPCWRTLYKKSLLDSPGLSSESHLSPSMFYHPGMYGEIGAMVVHKIVAAYNSMEARVTDRMRRAKYQDPPEVPGFVHDAPNGWAYASTIRAPYWDEESGAFEEGFFCRACAWRGAECGVPMWWRIIEPAPAPSWGIPWRRYTRDGIRAHLKEHGPIRKMWDIDAIKMRFWGYLRDDVDIPRYVGLPVYIHEGETRNIHYSPPDELLRIAPIVRWCQQKIVKVARGQKLISRWIMVPSIGYDQVLCNCGGSPCGTWRSTCYCWRFGRDHVPCSDDDCEVHHPRPPVRWL